MMVDSSQRDLGTTVLEQDIRTTVASIDRERLVGVSPLLA
jgi:hypothetical protein